MWGRAQTRVDECSRSAEGSICLTEPIKEHSCAARFEVNLAPFRMCTKKAVSFETGMSSSTRTQARGRLDKMSKVAIHAKDSTERDHVNKSIKYSVFARTTSTAVNKGIPYTARDSTDSLRPNSCHTKSKHTHTYSRYWSLLQAIRIDSTCLASGVFLQ